MGQLLSSIRGTQDHPDLQDATVEQQVSLTGHKHIESKQVTPTSVAQVSTAKPAQCEKGSMQSTTAAAAVKPGTTPASPAAPSVTASTAGAVGGGGAAGTAVTKKGPPQVTQQVQVEVGPAGKVSTEAGDPFDALSGTLPSSKPVAPKVPEHKGPEVKEEKKTPAGVPEKPKNVPKPSLDTDEALDILSGGFTAPAVAPVVKAPCPPQQEKTKPIAVPEKSKDVPKEKTKPSGFPEKPKDVPKPISTDDALDSLSVGFVSSAPSAPKKTELKTETVGAVGARCNFAPPPPYQQKQQVTSQPANVTKSPAPPVDKKVKMEKLDSSMPMDALSSLGDTLGAPEPPKKLPELKPGAIVDEKKIKSEKGVRVGEREDTLPPNYRFSEEELKKLPTPPKEPSLDTDEALDILSGGFTAPAVAPVVKAPCPPQQEKMKPTAVPEKSKDVPKEMTKPSGFPEKSKDVPKPKVEDLSALDALAGDFVAPAQTAHKVSSAVPNRVPPGPKQKPETEDALSALGDTLGATEPPKKLPELKPEDIVKEKDVTSEKGVRVGEREDTLPPDYRFSKEDLEKHPPPKTEPSLDVNEALDILSGDFKDTPAPSVTKISVCPSSKSPDKKSMDDTAALDHLTSKFTEVPTVKPSAPKAHHFTPEPVPQTHTAPGPALDQLAEKLIPNLQDTKPKDTKPKDTKPQDTKPKDSKPQDTKPKDSKPKKPSVEESLDVDKLSGQLSSDVVPSSSTKGGKR